MTDPRMELPAELRTIRTILVDAIIEALKAAPFKSPNLPVGDECAEKLFEFVDRGVLDDIKQQETPSARVEEGDEDITELMWPITQKTLRLFVHFKIIKVAGVDPQPMINYYFGRITEILVTPDHFADIALDISEAGNAVQAQGTTDPEPGGSIYFDVEFRHGFGNYFSETGNE